MSNYSQNDEDYTSDYVYDISAKDLEEELLGKKIVEISSSEITLNDGTVLHLKDATDCCAWYDYMIHRGKIVDHAITGVKSVNVDIDEGAEYSENFKLHILAGGITVADVDIWGVDAAGYYCHSIDMLIRRPVKKG